MTRLGSPWHKFSRVTSKVFATLALFEDSCVQPPSVMAMLALGLDLGLMEFSVFTL